MRNKHPLCAAARRSGVSAVALGFFFFSRSRAAAALFALGASFQEMFGLLCTVAKQQPQDPHACPARDGMRLLLHELIEAEVIAHDHTCKVYDVTINGVSLVRS